MGRKRIRLTTATGSQASAGEEVASGHDAEAGYLYPAAISSAATSWPIGRTRYGWPTSPSCRRWPAFSTSVERGGDSGPHWAAIANAVRIAEDFKPASVVPFDEPGDQI